MSGIMKRISARRRTPKVEMIWYDGSNGIEVAQWLQDHGTQVDVHFKSNGDVRLSMNGYRVDLPDGDHGIWLATDGQRYRHSAIEGQWDYEVLETR